MKYLLLILLISCCSIYSQTITDEEKNQIINNFHSDNILIKSEAISKIIEFKIPDVLDEVKNTIWTQPLLFKIDYLWILYSLESPDTKDIALSLIDSSYNYDFELDIMSAEDFRMQINEILLKLGDARNAESILQNNAEDPSRTASLTTLLDNEQYENRAKSNLIELALHSEDESVAAIIALEDKYPDEICNIYKDVIRNHPDYATRMLMLDDIVAKKCEGLREFINERLFIDQNETARNEFARLLIKTLGQPQDFKKFIEYHNWEQDTLYSAMSGFDIEDFVPIKPGSSVESIELLDSLKSYNSQLRNYGWIPSDSIAAKSNSKIDSIITLVQNNNLQQAKLKLTEYEQWVESLLNSEAIMPEAYKFLYHTASYAKERLNL